MGIKRRGRRGNNEGCVHQRKDKKWVGALTVGYENGKRKRKWVYADTRDEVVKKLKDEQDKVSKGLRPTDEMQTVGDYVEYWLEELVKPSVRVRTYESYKHELNKHILPALGKTRLSKLTPEHVQAFVAAKSTTLSPKTVRYHLSILRMALSKAERWGLVPRNVAKLVDAPRVPKRELEPMTAEQARAFLSALQGIRYDAGDVVRYYGTAYECQVPHTSRSGAEPTAAPQFWKRVEAADAPHWLAENPMADLFTLALSLGLRRGEVMGLRWIDVDLEAKTLRVANQIQRVNGELVASEPKTAESRRLLHLSDSLVALLKSHRAAQREARMKAGNEWTDTGLVFTSATGTPHDPRNVKRCLDRTLEAARLGHFRVHDLRHFAASLMLAKGVELKVVSTILGHADIRTTANVYADVLPDLQRAATDLLTGLLANGGGK